MAYTDNLVVDSFKKLFGGMSDHLQVACLCGMGLLARIRLGLYQEWVEVVCEQVRLSLFRTQNFGQYIGSVMLWGKNIALQFMPDYKEEEERAKKSKRWRSYGPRNGI